MDRYELIHILRCWWYFWHVLMAINTSSTGFYDNQKTLVFSIMHLLTQFNFIFLHIVTHWLLWWCCVSSAHNSVTCVNKTPLGWVGGGLGWSSDGEGYLMYFKNNDNWWKADYMWSKMDIYYLIYRINSESCIKVHPFISSSINP